MEPFGTESLQIKCHTEIGSHNDDLRHFLLNNTFCMLSYAKIGSHGKGRKKIELLEFDPLYSNEWNH